MLNCIGAWDKKRKINNTDPVFIKIIDLLFIMDFAFLFTFYNVALHIYLGYWVFGAPEILHLWQASPRSPHPSLCPVLGPGVCAYETPSTFDTDLGRSLHRLSQWAQGCQVREPQGRGCVMWGAGHTWAHAHRFPGSLLMERTVVGGGPKWNPLESGLQPQNLLGDLQGHIPIPQILI